MGFCECYCYREFVHCMRCRKLLWSESFVCLFVLQEWPNYNICFWMSRVLSIVPSYGNIFGFVRRPVSGSTGAFVCTHWVAFKAFILGLCIFDTTCSHCCILHHILYYVMIWTIFKQPWLTILLTCVVWSFVLFFHSHSATRLPLNKRWSL